MKPFAVSHWLKAWLIAAFMSFASLGASQSEFRGLWVDAWGAGFLNATEVNTLVSRCTAYNFNAVIVQMRRRGDAFYFPQAPNGEPRTTAISASFDALQDIITKCHAATPPIEVHCWTPTHVIWGDTGVPSQPGHVFNLHPEYLQRNSAGSMVMPEGYYLDPGHPDAATWNYNMAKDIVSRYDIDGFHWDYIRYPQQDSGYNPTAVARYNAEFGLSGQPSPGDANWSTWRRRQVTDFLRWTNSDLLQIKPNLIISASVFATRSDAYSNRFQDWAAWNAEGILDICCPMNYSSSNSTFNSRTDDAFNNQGVRWVYTGVGAYLNTAVNTVTQLNYSRNKPHKGSLYYSYRVPNSGTVDQVGTLTYVRDNYQPTYLPTPDLPWKTAPTKGIVKGTVTRSDNGAPIYNATITLQSAPVRTQKSEAHGKYAFFESTPGSFTIEATAPGLGNVSGTANIVAGQVVNVNLVVPTTDTTPPTLSNVTAGNLTDASALITWNTNESADSVVEYGTTTGYGSVASNASLVLNHSIPVTGLTANTTYHYRVRSADGSDNEAVSGDFTFTTLQPGSVADLIIDNPAATTVGVWTNATLSADKYGSDYIYNGQGTGAEHATYTPNILTGGQYNVYCWYPQGGNRTTGAPYVITHAGGTNTVSVNQQSGGGQWNLLGTYTFNIGTGGRVRITDATPVSGFVVMADAIKFSHVPAASPPPAAPSGLSAAAVSSSQIDLSWTDNSADETNFVVGRSAASGGPYTDIATLGFNVTSYSDSGLATSTPYYYVVRATNASGASANSAQATATTLDIPPATPGDLAASPVSSSQINLTWTDNASNETNFIVSRSEMTGGPYTDIATLAANAASYSDTGLAGSTTYYYTVRATNSAGDSGLAPEASATTPAAPQPPAAPSGLSATSAGASQINLAWTDNSGNETNFVVARSTTSGGPYTDIVTLGANVTSYNNTGLASGTTYHYVVRAINADGSSANSSQASATTNTPPPVPVAPSNCTGTALSRTSIQVSWADNSLNETNFVLEYKKSTVATWTAITLPANTATTPVTGLVRNTTYNFRVKATNASGSSAYSNTATIKTLK